MDSGELKPCPSGTEAGCVRRAGHLCGGTRFCAPVHPGLDGRKDQFTRQTAEADLAAVIDEGQTLVVAGVAFGGVSDQVLPMPPEVAHQPVQCCDVATHLLDGHEVE